MRLSEAVLLGDSLKICSAGEWLSADGSCGCALGGALLAAGVSPKLFDKELEMNQTEPRGWFNRYNAPEQFAEMATVKRLWPWLTAMHVDVISDMYYRVEEGLCTIERIADYVRSVEPDEPAESVVPSHVETSEEILKTV